MSAWWDEDHKLLLITPDEFAALPDGEVLTCIDDTTVIKGTDEIDDDTRGGHLAFGVVGEHPLRVAYLEKTLSAPKRQAVPIPAHKAWNCTIGVMGTIDLPSGADGPMRQAVEKAFRDITGIDAEFTFSGWGAELNEYEYDVVAGMKA